MPIPQPPSVDRFAATLAGIQADLETGARAGAPGCILVVIVAIAGFIALMNRFEWDSGWETNPATLVGIAAYLVALGLVWKAGTWWARPGASVGEAAIKRLETDVLQPLIGAIRPGARYVAKAEAPKRTFERSRMIKSADFTSANQIRWRGGDLDFEMFEIESIVSNDSPPSDRYFVGSLAWTELANAGPNLTLVVRSRHEFPNTVPAPHDSTALSGFAINSHYRVISNWEPFARAACTPALQDRLLRIAREGVCVHVALADGRAWVGIEVEKDPWFRGYPTWFSRLPETLDNDHVALLARQIAIVEELGIELANAHGTASRET